MKFRKKVLPLIIGITLAAGSLSGCGNNSAATESQTTEAVTPAATEATVGYQNKCQNEILNGI